MGEPCKGYAKSKKPDSKGHVLFNSIYMKYPELAKRRERKQFIGSLGLGTCRLTGAEENGVSF